MSRCRTTCSVDELAARAAQSAQRLALSMLKEYCRVLFAHADVARKQRAGANLTVIIADDVRTGGRVTGLHPPLRPPPGYELGADGAPIAVTYTPTVPRPHPHFDCPADIGSFAPS